MATQAHGDQWGGECEWKMKSASKDEPGWRRRWICDEEDAPFSGGLSRSRANGPAQMDNRKRGGRTQCGIWGRDFRNFPLASQWRRLGFGCTADKLHRRQSSNIQVLTDRNWNGRNYTRIPRRPLFFAPRSTSRSIVRLASIRKGWHRRGRATRPARIWIRANQSLGLGGFLFKCNHVWQMRFR